MDALSQGLYRLSTGRTTFFTTLLFAVFIAAVLPNQAALAQAYSAGAGTPDTTFFYSADQLYSMAEAYGPEGRQAYVYARLTFDAIFPLVFTAFFVTALSWLLNRVLAEGSKARLLNLVPLFGMLFDYVENVSAALVMTRYPSQTAVIEWLAPLGTALKWTFINASMLLLVFSLVLCLVRSVKRRRANSDTQ
jgi:hypothetical protein